MKIYKVFKFMRKKFSIVTHKSYQIFVIHS